ncbi:MAG: hypothetical protein ACFB16_25380, partial [Phormidesmis sp.]
MATDETLRILTELGQQVSGLMQRVKELETENAELQAANKSLRDRPHQQGHAKASKSPKFSQDYSVEHNQGKSKSKRGKQATGRRTHHLMLELVDEHVTLYEPGVSETACVERGVQYGWRLVGGAATYICYHLYALP